MMGPCKTAHRTEDTDRTENTQLDTQVPSNYQQDTRLDDTRGWTREAQGASLEDDLGHPEKRKRPWTNTACQDTAPQAYLPPHR